jgi:hypothetical protein
MLNIMETTKPKLKRPKLRTGENRVARIVSGERNETRVRIRPNCSIVTELGDTEKINKGGDSDEEELESDG